MPDERAPGDPDAVPALSSAPPTLPRATLGRAPPAEVLESHTRLAEPWAPGLELVRVERGASWPEHRSLLRDVATGDVRRYAIGDLVPHGSVLVAIEDAAVVLMVADSELVRLGPEGVASVEDFRTADAPKRNPDFVAAEEPDPDFLAALDAALVALMSDDPALVQAAVDALIEAGETVLPHLVPHVGDPHPVAPHTVDFGHRTGVPRVRGDTVIGIVEAVSGERFGDVFAAASASERAEIAGRWLRWWGVDE